MGDCRAFGSALYEGGGQDPGACARKACASGWTGEAIRKRSEAAREHICTVDEGYLCMVAAKKAARWGQPWSAVQLSMWIGCRSGRTCVIYSGTDGGKVAEKDISAMVRPCAAPMHAA